MGCWWWWCWCPRLTPWPGSTGRTGRRPGRRRSTGGSAPGRDTPGQNLRNHCPTYIFIFLVLKVKTSKLSNILESFAFTLAHYLDQLPRAPFDDWRRGGEGGGQERSGQERGGQERGGAGQERGGQERGLQERGGGGQENNSGQVSEEVLEVVPHVAPVLHVCPVLQQHSTHGSTRVTAARAGAPRAGGGGAPALVSPRWVTVVGGRNWPTRNFLSVRQSPLKISGTALGWPV